MLRRLFVGVLALFAFAAVSTANAQDVEVTLGEETALKIIPDKDTIDTVKIPGRYRGIRVYALEGSSVDIAKIDIVYSDGFVFTEDRGKLIQLNYNRIDKMWWPTVFPCLMLFMTVLSFNLIGDRVARRFDIREATL